MKLRKSLFWDVDSKKVQHKKDVDFIIGRVLDFGNIQEWEAIKDFYGLPTIRRVARRHIFSDFRSLNFWALILGINSDTLKTRGIPY